MRAEGSLEGKENVGLVMGGLYVFLFIGLRDYPWFWTNLEVILRWNERRDMGGLHQWQV